MQICPDPLDTVRCVGPNEQWCVSLPASYPTIIPFVPNNIEYDGQTTFNTIPFPSGFINYESGDIIESSLCANSHLIQRIRHKVDLYQTPSSNDAHQILQRLTNIVKQHVPNFAFKEVVNGDNVREQVNQNIRQDIIPTPSGALLPSKTPSFLQKIFNGKKQDQHVLSKDSSHHSRLTNNSVHSANISNFDIRANDGSNQFSPIQSLQSLSSTTNEKNVDRKNSKVLSPISSDHNDRGSIVMSIPVPSISSTPMSEEQLMPSQLRQAVHNMMSTTSQQNDSPMMDQHLDSTHLISAIDLKNSSFLSPSTKVMHDGNEPEKRSSWITKLVKKISSKRLNTASFQDIPKENISNKKLIDQNKIDPAQLHMEEAMDALKLDLTKEAFQALINKKKDLKQNGLMHILTAPARCCRSCRTQRRLATVTQRSIDIAIKNIQTPLVNSEIQLIN